MLHMFKKLVESIEEMEDVKKTQMQLLEWKIQLEKNILGGINGWLVTVNENLKVKTKQRLSKTKHRVKKD